MAKRILSFRLERSAIELIESKNRNKSSVVREAINYAINGHISKEDILKVALFLPVDVKRQVSVKVDEETLDKLKKNCGRERRTGKRTSKNSNMETPPGRRSR